MSPGKRITKRHIKEDKLVSTAFQASEYIQKNKNYFITGIATIIAIGFIIYFINLSITRKDTQAREILGKAQIAAAMQQFALAINDYKAIIEKYGSTEAAERATFILARIYYDQNDCDSAFYYYQYYIDNYGKTKILLSAAHGAIADCAEQQSDFARAAEYYFKAAEISNDDLSSPGYYMAAGRAYIRVNDYVNAEKSFQMIVDNYQKSPQFQGAEKKLAEVKYKLN